MMKYELIRIQLPETKMSTDEVKAIQDRLNALADDHQEVVATFVDQGSNARQLIVVVK